MTRSDRHLLSSKGYTLPGALGTLAVIALLSHVAIVTIDRNIENTRVMSLEQTIKSVNRVLKNAYDARAKGLPETIDIPSIASALTSKRVYSDANRNGKIDSGESIFHVSSDLSVLTAPNLPNVEVRIQSNPPRAPKLYLVK